MKKLLIVIHSMSGGGAERVVSRILQHMHASEPGVSVTLALLKPQIDYAIPPSVRVEILGRRRESLPGKIFGMLGTFAKLRALTKELNPDAVLSFMPAANLMSLATKKTCTALTGRFVVSERVALEANYHGLKKVALFGLMSLLYPSADNILCVAKGIKDELVELGIPKDLCSVVNNAVDGSELHKKAQERAPHPWSTDTNTPLFVTAGRLTQQKGQDVFVKALGLLARQGVSARALIFGTGELADQLTQQIEAEGLTAHVKMMGFNANPYPEISAATAFVFPSRWEGFPNALLEAMAMGTPVIAADCPFGPKELIGANEFGRLVPVDAPEALAAALLEVIQAQRSDGLFENEHQKARAGASRFTPEKMMSEYSRILFG